MPLGLIARLRRHRRGVVLAAAGLLAVQAFLAGLSMAQAGLMLSPNLAGADGLNIICHGNGGAGSDHGTAPEPAGNPHPCCAACMAGAPPATLPEQALVLRPDRRRDSVSALPCPASIRIAPRAVRAGTSQAPPRLD